MSNYNSHKWFTAMGFLIGVIIVLSLPLAYLTSAQDVNFTVDEKERVVTSEDSYYLVFSAEGEVYKNTDSLLFRKFNSSDVHNEMDVGDECSAKVAGWRVPVLSMYPNIIEVECTEAG